MNVTGKYNSADIKIDNIDSNTYSQILNMCNQVVFDGSIIKVMPDCHPSKTCLVGFTSTFTDKISPAVIGGDIGCGMLVSEFKKNTIELAQLDKLVQNGLVERKKIDNIVEKYNNQVDFDSLFCKKYVNLERVYESMGTLGSGNHFIELDEMENGHKILIIHSGSRLLGTQIYEYYMSKCNGSANNYMYNYLEGELLEQYLHDVLIACQFAKYNRECMAEIISKGLNNKIISNFETIHNYIDIKQKILRKGAIDASKDKMVIIPLNMRDGCLLCIGKGNKDWNYSAPHGAGRLYSRKEIKDLFTLNEYKKEMKNVFSSSINSNTLDEAPMAYKDSDFIINHIQDTVDILDQTKVLYNFKNSSK